MYDQLRNAEREGGEESSRTAEGRGRKVWMNRWPYMGYKELHIKTIMKGQKWVVSKWALVMGSFDT